MDVKRFLQLWAPVAAWCGLIYFLSSIPHLSTGLGKWDLLLRKLAHVTEYAVLAVLFWRALSGSSSLQLTPLFWSTLLFCFLYAASDLLVRIDKLVIEGELPVDGLDRLYRTWAARQLAGM